MSKNNFMGFQVKRYRSLLDVKIDIDGSNPVIVCGENNIGKTNLLRALNIFFNHTFQANLFNASEDIPHHIYYGSQGAGSKTELTGFFEID
jgi:AAA15 family ATPase/GTPase